MKAVGYGVIVLVAIAVFMLIAQGEGTKVISLLFGVGKLVLIFGIPALAVMGLAAIGTKRR